MLKFRLRGALAVASIIAIAYGGLALVTAPFASASPGSTARISVAGSGTEANGMSGSSVPSAISGDGRYVAFVSYATNLVSGVGTAPHAYLRDTVLGTTEEVDVDSAGHPSNGGGVAGLSITPDGRYVAFGSNGSNLVSADTNNGPDVFVRDRQTGTTEQVSLDNSGQEAPTAAFNQTAISADGRYVVFQAEQGFSLLPNDTNEFGDVYLRDRQAATTELVSVDSGGHQADASSGLSSSGNAISADGRYVLFMSHAFSSSLAAGGAPNRSDAYVRDRQAGTTDRVSVDSLGTEGNSDTGWAAINASGRYVAFTSSASNLVPGDTNGNNDVFIRDRQTGQTTSAGTTGNGPALDVSIDGAGRYVAFDSFATNLTSTDANGFAYDVFVFDRQLNTTALVSTNSAGVQDSFGTSFLPAISADGHFVAFSSEARELVPNDTNEAFDVFVKELGTSDTTPPTVSCAVTPTFLLHQGGAAVSATVTDGGSGPVASPVTVPVSTATVGTFSTNVTGADQAGNSTTAACSYRVVYQFSGFSQPIDNPPIVNTANAGQAIPVKWRLTDANGVGIADPASFVSVTTGSRACLAGDPSDAIETYTGNSGLQYLGDGNWQFNWKTPKSEAGQCRVMHLNLADGSTTHVANFQFK